MASLIRINSVVQRPNGKLFVNATLPDGRVVEGQIDVSLDQTSIARAVAQLPAERPMPHLTGQVALEDDEYRELRTRAILAEEEARRAAQSLAPASLAHFPGELSISSEGVLSYSVSEGTATTITTPEAFAAAVADAEPAKPAAARGRK